VTSGFCSCLGHGIASRWTPEEMNATVATDEEITRAAVEMGRMIKQGAPEPVRNFV
jgi:hypothetical protein